MTLGSSPGQLTRFGAQQAGAGLGGVEVQIFIRSDGGSLAFGRLGLSRRPGVEGQAPDPDPVVPQDAVRDEDALALVRSTDCGDVLHFACQGVLVQCATRSASPASNGQTGPGLAAAWESVGRRSELVRGHVRSNPGFLYEDVRLSELMLTLDAAPAVRTWAVAAALMDATARLAREARTAHAPILYLQAPVSPYEALTSSARGDGSVERPRAARAVAIRAAIGVDARHPRRRIELEAAVAEYAAERGMGLEVRDRRPGMVRGDWFTLVRQEREGRERFGEYAAGLVRGAGTEPVRGVRPVVIAGPGRIGSSATCLGLLSRLGAGLCGVSITAAQDIALINLVLADRGTAPPDAAEADQPPRRPADYQDLADGLRNMASKAVRYPGFPEPDQPRGLDRVAGDYVLIAGRRRQLDAAAVAAPDPSATAWALWASWDLPATRFAFADVTGALLDGLQDECRSVAGNGPVSARLEYARSRVLAGGRFKGRAKLSLDALPVPPDLNVQTFLQRICDRAEIRARELLRGAARNTGHGPRPGDGDPDTNPGDGDPAATVLPGDVRLQWRERWLGKGQPVM